MSVGDDDLDAAAFEGPDIRVANAVIGDKRVDDVQST
jgi:hypothetical protein